MVAAARLQHRGERLRGLAVRALAIVPALAVLIGVAGGDGANWEMAQSTPAHMPGSVSVPVEPAEKPADRAGLPLSAATIYPQIGESTRNSNLAAADMHKLQTALDALYHPGATVTIESIVVAAATGRVRELGGPLTEAEVRAVLTVAGFEGVLFDEALRVSFGESVGWQPRIMGDGGRAYGLFQLHADPWAGWCGVTPEELLEPVVNATCARRIVMEYEVPRGYPRWSNWSVKP